MSDAGTPRPEAQMPLLYKQPRPLQPARHGGSRFVAPGGYGYAAELTAVPLNGVEFAAAGRHYPIVFADADPPLPLAVLGLRQGENLMLEADGRWAAGAYVPAYIRRYPFIFLEEQGGQRLTLCVDEASGMLSNSAGEPLFADGEPAPFVRRATEFCAAFQRHHVATRGFAQALQAAGLLAQRTATVRPAEGEPMQLGGFRLIDEERFNGLPDAQFLDWRRRGWLPLVYTQLASAASWQQLGDRLARGGAAMRERLTQAGSREGE